MDMARKRAKEIDVDITFSIMRTNLKDDILQKVENNIEKNRRTKKASTPKKNGK